MKRITSHSRRIFFSNSFWRMSEHREEVKHQKWQQMRPNILSTEWPRCRDVVKSNCTGTHNTDIPKEHARNVTNFAKIITICAWSAATYSPRCCQKSAHGWWKAIVFPARWNASTKRRRINSSFTGPYAFPAPSTPVNGWFLCCQSNPSDLMIMTADTNRMTCIKAFFTSNVRATTWEQSKLAKQNLRYTKNRRSQGGTAEETSRIKAATVWCEHSFCFSQQTRK